MKHLLTVWSFLLLAIAQGQDVLPAFDGTNRQGQAWFHWGYNRSAYSLSDIHFTGPDYDFTLYGVEATDRPSEFDVNTYLNPTQFTVPQFNFRIGYFIRPRTSISFGWEHMKYVLLNGSNARISGEIGASVSSEYAGTYNNEEIELAHRFIRYEHTDGLNYVRFNIDQTLPLLRIKNGTHQLNAVLGAGLGPALTYSDAYLWGTYHRTKPHISGFGMSLNAGLRLEFFKRFFFAGTLMGGYITLPNALTSLETDRASQHFWFGEYHITGGMFIPLKGGIKFK